MTPTERGTGDRRRGARMVSIGQAEEELFETFGSFAAREINLCEKVSTCLMALVQRNGPGPIRSDPSEELTPEQLRLGAMIGIAIRTIRAMRAALAVLSVGYEVEGGVYDRLLIELRGRMAQIADDASGEIARKWLQGQAPTRISRIWANPTMKSLYANLSTAVHADSRAFGPLVEPSVDTLLIGPRRSSMTRASLIAQSVVGYEVLATLSRESGITISGADELIGEIGEAVVALQAPLENAKP